MPGGARGFRLRVGKYREPEEWTREFDLHALESVGSNEVALTRN